MSTVVEYTFDEWLEWFTPAYNHIDDTHGFDGCLFETYGRELEYVSSLEYKHLVWTICEDDDGILYMVNGLRHVNRVGFLVTENNYAEHELVFVSFEEGN